MFTPRLTSEEAVDNGRNTAVVHSPGNALRFKTAGSDEAEHPLWSGAFLVPPYADFKDSPHADSL